MIDDPFSIRKSTKWLNLCMWEDVSNFSGTDFFSNHPKSTRNPEKCDCLEARTSHAGRGGDDAGCSWEDEISNFCCKISISSQVSLSPTKIGIKFDKPDWFSTCTKQSNQEIRKCNHGSVFSFFFTAIHATTILNKFSFAKFLCNFIKNLYS